MVAASNITSQPRYLRETIVSIVANPADVIGDWWSVVTKRVLLAASIRFLLPAVVAYLMYLMGWGQWMDQHWVGAYLLTRSYLQLPSFLDSTLTRLVGSLNLFGGLLNTHVLVCAPDTNLQRQVI